MGAEGVGVERAFLLGEHAHVADGRRCGASRLRGDERVELRGELGDVAAAAVERSLDQPEHRLALADLVGRELAEGGLAAAGVVLHLDELVLAVVLDESRCGRARHHVFLVLSLNFLLKDLMAASSLAHASSPLFCPSSPSRPQRFQQKNLPSDADARTWMM